MMEVVGVQRRVAGSGEWLVPLGERHGGSGAGSGGGGQEYDGIPSGLQCPSGWLLLEFPTALLMAVFVGTGWLGYAQHGRPTIDGPIPAVVVPAPHTTVPQAPGTR